MIGEKGRRRSWEGVGTPLAQAHWAGVAGARAALTGASVGERG